MKTEIETAIHLGQMKETEINLDGNRDTGNKRFMKGYIKALKWVLRKT